MFLGTRGIGVAMLAGAAVLGMAQPCAARFSRGRSYHRSGRRYNHGRRYGSGGGSYGGYLNGAANVINAQGRYLVNIQTAYLLKEKARAALLDNRRRIFEEHLYEKSLTPTLNDKRILAQQVALRRALTHPPETEIWSGESLNVLLTHIKELHSKSDEVPDVILDPAVLRRINLTVTHVGNLGLLKTAGRLQWPAALQTLQPQGRTAELRNRIDSLLSEGRKQASKTGHVDGAIPAKLEKDAEEFGDQLVYRVAECSFHDYTHAKNFLRQLDEAVKLLKQPDVGNYFNGNYQPKGDSVAELVRNMTEKGLKFAPAIAGEEAAYSGLFASMVQYYFGADPTILNQSAIRNFYRDLYQKTRMYQQQNPLAGLPLPPSP